MAVYLLSLNYGPATLLQTGQAEASIVENNTHLPDFYNYFTIHLIHNMNHSEISAIIIGIIGILFTAIGAIEGLKYLWNLYRKQISHEDRDLEHQIPMPTRSVPNRSHLQSSLDSPHGYTGPSTSIFQNNTYVHVGRNNGDFQEFGLRRGR
ncbi:hypothetical protein BDD12DRAFT_34092 [Trichophaea hybrida]|nr:hypothetical protein BDD12DRAFT_34092 [Trichophaea hybrida]